LLEEQQPNAVPWWEAILVIVVTFFVFLFGSVPVLLFFGDAPALILGEILILAVPLGYLLLKRVNIRSYVRISLNPKYILLGVGFGVALLFLNAGVSAALVALLGQSQAVNESNKIITQLSGTPGGLIVVAVSLTLAGICEEFAFRGFLQNSIFRSLKVGKTSRYAFLAAVVIAAGTFGLFHFDPQFVYIIAAFITGLVLGAIYHKFNYTTSATTHAVMNLLVLALLLMGM
jgi:membrane protease YdiL (CAAX protease family)